MLKNNLLLLLLSFLAFSISFGQGTNNDFDFDNEDLEFVFDKMGFNVFKFPIQQSKDQLFDIVLEEYKGGVLESRQTAIGITQKAFEGYGVDAKSYAKPRMDSTQLDSVYFHRFYMEKNDTLLTLHVKTHGISAPVKFDVKDLYIGDVRARYETKEEIDSKGYLDLQKEKKVLLLFYGNKDDSQPLWCPAGIPLEQLKKKFYYTVLVYAEEI